MMLRDVPWSFFPFFAPTMRNFPKRSISVQEMTSCHVGTKLMSPSDSAWTGAMLQRTGGRRSAVGARALNVEKTTHV